MGPTGLRIIVGDGGSGKSMATNAAIGLFKPTDEENDYNVYVWNEGEMPGLYRSADGPGWSDKWILTRRDFDDNLTRGLIEEWGDRCRVVHFERGTEENV
jgi:ABC-type dipeptide/oligopeptide/nickel transport system ATPase component